MLALTRVSRFPLMFTRSLLIPRLTVRQIQLRLETAQTASEGFLLVSKLGTGPRVGPKVVEISGIDVALFYSFPFLRQPGLVTLSCRVYGFNFVPVFVPLCSKVFCLGSVGKFHFPDFPSLFCVPVFVMFGLVVVHLFSVVLMVFVFDFVSLLSLPSLSCRSYVIVRIFLL